MRLKCKSSLFRPPLFFREVGHKKGGCNSGEVRYYAEAIECLQSCYISPHLTHPTHVRMILESSALKDGSGKELCCLHDLVQHHLRALAIQYEHSGPIITSVLELKLDVNARFEGQKHSQDATDVPHYQKLLEFINFCAEASKVLISSHKGP